MIELNNNLNFDLIEEKAKELPDNFNAEYVMFDVESGEFIDYITNTSILINKGLLFNLDKDDVIEYVQELKEQLLKRNCDDFFSNSPYFMNNNNVEMDLDIFSDLSKYKTEFEMDMLKFKAQHNPEFREEILFGINTYTEDNSYYDIAINGFAYNEEELINFISDINNIRHIEGLIERYEFIFNTKLNSDIIDGFYSKSHIINEKSYKF